MIPVLNEGENVVQLIHEIQESLASILEYEIIFVDDGSDDNTPDLVRKAMQDRRVRLLSHSMRAGQSKAVRNGVEAARAKWVATLDGDCQNDPHDLLSLWEIASGPADPPALIMGMRQRRRDTMVKRLSSRIANAVRRLFLADECPDSGCGIRMFDRDAFLQLPWFDHMHRFLPALFRSAGHPTVSAQVRHRPRTRGRSKYGLWDRLWVGIVDLFGVLWLRKRSGPRIIVHEETGERPPGA